jgi:SAM-dependent methyltransferase
MYDSKHWDDIYNNCLTNEKIVPWEQPDVVNKHKEIINNILSSLSLQREKTLLDYGCGTGIYIDLFIEKGYEVTVVDISSVAINKCKKLYGEKIKNSLIQEFPDNINDKYDVVICWGVMHHIEPKNWNTFIEKFYKLLNDSGILIISGWDKENYRFINHNGISNNTHFKTWAINDKQNDMEKELENYFTIIENKKFSLSIADGDNNFRYYVCQINQEISLLVKLKKLIKDNPNISFAEFIYYDIKDNIEKARCNKAKSKVLYNSESYDVLKSDMMKTFYEIFIYTCEYKKFKHSMEEISLTDMMYERKNKKNVFFYSNITSANKKFNIGEVRGDTTLQISNLSEEEISKLSEENFKPQKWQNEITIEDKFELVRDNLNSGTERKFYERCFEEKKANFNKLKPSEYNNYKDEYKKLFDFYYYIFHQEKIYFYYFTNPIYDVNNSVYGNGDLILHCRNPLKEEVVDKIEFLFTKWSSALTTYTYANKNHQESIKSAIAAIMSRNISHNLGSHILFYIKEHLKNVKTIFEDNIFAELINTTIKDADWDNNDFSLKLKVKECLEEELKEIEKARCNSDEKLKQKVREYNDELPFLVGLGHFISYLQERQDYIATICTGYVPYFSSVDFKRAIYDELTPDACHARHHENRKYEKPKNLLLKYIAKSEGFGREIKDNSYNGDNIVIKFREFGGLNEEKDNEDNFIDHPQLSNMRNIKFSLPGGYTGRQAFFSIFENIIRNAAKHGKLKSSNTNLEFTIDVWEKSDLDKEKDKFWNVYKEASDINDLQIIKITDNCEIDDSILLSLTENLKDIYIDGSGNLKGTNKGLKEMRISAAWLRNELHNIERHINNDNAPILQVHKTEKNNLEYIFCIQQPKEIAFIVVDTKKFQNIQNILQKQYCNFFSVEEFTNDTKLNYNFIVCEGNIYDNILPYSHSTITKMEEGELLQYFKDCSNDNVIKSTIKEIKEKIFIKLINNNNMNAICISDEKVNRKYDKNKKAQIKENVNIIDGGFINEKYIYKTHFESTREFYQFMESNFNRIEEIEFVEGITGHNSTARLLRTEEIDKLWYYKHLNAMKTKVAVFDERFFDRYTKISHKDILQYDDWWNKIINNRWNKIKERYKLSENDVVDYADLKSFMDKEDVKSEFDLIKKEIMNKDNGNIINEKNGLRYLKEVVDPVSLKSFMDEEAIVKSEFNTKKELLSPYLYKLKGVEFFNIVWREITEEFVIVGYSNVKHSLNGNEYKYDGCVYKIVGTISYPNKKVKIKFTDGFTDDYKTKFNFICIHQGLLDKIYAKFDIKKADSKNSINAKNRANVTKELHKKFTNIEPVYMIDKDYDYLPKFIIHSGRSKPSNEDMPQHQPFIQFSALENVIADCKYSLVELLNMAHYE